MRILKFLSFQFVFLFCGRLYYIFYVVEMCNLGLQFGVQFLEAIFLQESVNKYTWGKLSVFH